MSFRNFMSGGKKSSTSKASANEEGVGMTVKPEAAENSLNKTNGGANTSIDCDEEPLRANLTTKKQSYADFKKERDQASSKLQALQRGKAGRAQVQSASPSSSAPAAANVKSDSSSSVDNITNSTSIKDSSSSRNTNTSKSQGSKGGAPGDGAPKKRASFAVASSEHSDETLSRDSWGGGATSGDGKGGLNLAQQEARKSSEHAAKAFAVDEFLVRLARSPEVLFSFLSASMPPELSEFLLSEAFEASCAQKFQELVASEEREGRSARSMNDGTVGLTLNAMRPVVDNLAEGNPKAVTRMTNSSSGNNEDCNDSAKDEKDKSNEPTGLTAQIAGRFLDIFDHDGNGVIDVSEFVHVNRFFFTVANLEDLADAEDKHQSTSGSSDSSSSSTGDNGISNSSSSGGNPGVLVARGAADTSSALPLDAAETAAVTATARSSPPPVSPVLPPPPLAESVLPPPLELQPSDNATSSSSSAAAAAAPAVDASGDAMTSASATTAGAAAVHETAASQDGTKNNDNDNNNNKALEDAHDATAVRLSVKVQALARGRSGRRIAARKFARKALAAEECMHEHDDDGHGGNGLASEVSPVQIKIQQAKKMASARQALGEAVKTTGLTPELVWQQLKRSGHLRTNESTAASLADHPPAPATAELAHVASAISAAVGGVLEAKHPGMKANLLKVDRSVGEGEGRITLAQFIGGWGILTGVGPSSVSEAKSLAESEALKQKQVAVQKARKAAQKKKAAEEAAKQKALREAKLAAIQEKAAARAAALAESKTLTGTAASSNGDGVETSSSSSTDAGSAPPAVAEAISFPTLSPEEQWQELLKLLQPQRLMDAPTLQALQAAGYLTKEAVASGDDTPLRQSGLSKMKATKLKSICAAAVQAEEEERAYQLANQKTSQSKPKKNSSTTTRSPGRRSSSVSNSSSARGRSPGKVRSSRTPSTSSSRATTPTPSVAAAARVVTLSPDDAWKELMKVLKKHNAADGTVLEALQAAGYLTKEAVASGDDTPLRQSGLSKMKATKLKSICAAAVQAEREEEGEKVARDRSQKERSTTPSSSPQASSNNPPKLANQKRRPSAKPPSLIGGANNNNNNTPTGTPTSTKTTTSNNNSGSIGSNNSSRIGGPTVKRPQLKAALLKSAQAQKNSNSSSGINGPSARTNPLHLPRSNNPSANNSPAKRRTSRSSSRSSSVSRPPSQRSNSSSRAPPRASGSASTSSSSASSSRTPRSASTSRSNTTNGSSSSNSTTKSSPSGRSVESKKDWSKASTKKQALLPPPSPSRGALFAAAASGNGGAAFAHSSSANNATSQPDEDYTHFGHSEQTDELQELPSPPLSSSTPVSPISGARLSKAKVQAMTDEELLNHHVGVPDWLSAPSPRVDPYSLL